MMNDASEVWENVFAEPEFPSGKKEPLPGECKRRYQLLDYDDVMKLSSVMETTVPIDGKGNFPSLEVTPSTLVQMVRDGLRKEGICVPNVRLNGSAATHVLSDNGKHPYTDLDLIFAVDLSEYSNDACTCSHVTDTNLNTNNNNFNRTKVSRKTGRKFSTTGSKESVKSRSADCNPDQSDDAINDTSAASNTLMKDLEGDDYVVDCEDKESGYTSSGSSVASLPISPAGSWAYQNPVRSRTHSLDSASSVTSSSSMNHVTKQGNPNQRKPHSEHHDFCARSKDSCWQKIKGVVMSILRDLLPAGVTSSRMTDAIMTDAYVQKMVKITSDVDRWSLFSLHNNSGRNLELKFVENMRRQYEFSVDSFQIILDSYQRFKIVSRNLEDDKTISLSPQFFPSVLAESVYGDFEAALRHLRHRRICTKRPEEIRGGGLLRYCNLRVRDFSPGEVEGYKIETDDTDEDASGENVQSYSSANPESVKRLEQLMCSRFFIDFSEFDRQQRKVLSYLNSHFQGEEDLKFQYLLIVRNVVERGTVCLMSNERTKIVEYIKKLAIETLSKNVSSGPTGFIENSPKHAISDPAAHLQTYAPSNAYPQYQYPVCSGQPNYSDSGHSYYPQYAPTSYAPSYYYPCPPYYPESGYYPQYEGYCPAPQNVPIAMCPCCRSTYPTQKVDSDALPTDQTQPSEVAITSSQHTMSVTSPPFIPSTKINFSEKIPNPIKVIYLGENDKLIYNAGPAVTEISEDTGTCSPAPVQAIDS